MKAARLGSIAALALTISTTVGCGERPGRQGAPLPKPPPVVPVTMSEYRFTVARSVPGGRVVFRVRNTGDLHHRVTLVALPEDMPPIEVQLRGTERRYLEPFAGMPERRPGVTSSFAVDLDPGLRYGFICFTVDRDNKNHAEKGMVAEFRTTGRPVPTQVPAPTAPSSPAAGDEEA